VSKIRPREPLVLGLYADGLAF
jgi:hypothetical protein